MISIYPEMSFYLNDNNDIDIMAKTPQNLYSLPTMTNSSQPAQAPTLLSQQYPDFYNDPQAHDNFNHQANNNLSVGMPLMNNNNFHCTQVASDMNTFPMVDNRYYQSPYCGPRVPPPPLPMLYNNMNELNTIHTYTSYPPPPAIRRPSMNTSRSSSPCSVYYQGTNNSLRTRSPSPVNKRYICHLCNKRFTRPSSLTTHTYSHTGEKPFKCLVEGCGRKFSVVSNLRRHAKIHSSNDIHPSRSSSSSTAHSSP